MNQIMNWICFISVSFLVLEVMIFLCREMINEYENIYKKSKATNIEMTSKEIRNQTYREKIAK